MKQTIKGVMGANPQKVYGLLHLKEDDNQTLQNRPRQYAVELLLTA